MNSGQGNTKGKVLSKNRLHTFLAKDFYHKSEDAPVLFCVLQPSITGMKYAPCWFGEN